MVNIDQINSWCQGRLLSFRNGMVKDLVIDSRKISDPEFSLFVAINTQRRDGNAFIPEAYAKNVRHFLVQQEPDTDQFPDATFILVKDTLHALQQIAANH